MARTPPESHDLIFGEIRSRRTNPDARWHLMIVDHVYGAHRDRLWATPVCGQGPWVGVSTWVRVGDYTDDEPHVTLGSGGQLRTPTAFYNGDD